MKAYTTVPSSDDNDIDDFSEEQKIPRQPRFSIYSVTILGVVLALPVGFLLGFLHGHRSTGPTRIAPSEETHYYMSFNGSFPQTSNEKSNAVWDSLFPEKLGFVQHPELAPNVAGIAVFHELHCLNILRKSFFAALDGSLEEMGADSHAANDRTSHHHIRHCFEYLRQSLICLADGNLEEMNYTTRGVSGWQTERTCRSFEKLTAWADEWGISREEALQNWDNQTQAFGN